MILIKKDLKTVKNKLLCELEDYIFDSVMPLISNTDKSKAVQDKLVLALMKDVLEAIKENDKRIGSICYTDESGKDLTEDDLMDIPLKIRIMNECLPEIMEIMSDYIGESGEVKESGKPPVKRIRKKRSSNS